MYRNPDAYSAVPIGVVLRRTPGVTRWQKWAWKVTAVLPGAGPAEVDGEIPLEVLMVTASPYEAQDYMDSGEEVVEKVPMPPLLRAMVVEFIDKFYEEKAFIKRKRDKKRIDLVEDGIGDPRVGKAADIYASPAQLRRRMQ